MDELPMLYGSMAFMYTSVEDELHRKFHGLEYALLAISVLLTTIYVAFPSLYLIFLVAYTVPTFMVAWIAHKKARRDYLHSAHVQRCYWAALYSYFGGVAIWLFENAFCAYLPGWWQLHAIWHLTAGFGTYMWCQLTLAFRAEQYQLPYYFMPQSVVPFTQVKHKAAARPLSR